MVLLYKVLPFILTNFAVNLIFLAFLTFISLVIKTGFTVILLATLKDL